MDKELKNKFIAMLEKGIEDPIVDRDINVEAVLLKSEGYLAEGERMRSTNSPTWLRTSIAGHRYLERLKHPNRVWVRKNWFPVVVAGITAFTALASVIVQIVGLTLNSDSGQQMP